jgi:hypothetical protein
LASSRTWVLSLAFAVVTDELSSGDSTDNAFCKVTSVTRFFIHVFFIFASDINRVVIAVVVLILMTAIVTFFVLPVSTLWLASNDFALVIVLLVIFTTRLWLGFDLGDGGHLFLNLDFNVIVLDNLVGWLSFSSDNNRLRLSLDSLLNDYRLRSTFLTDDDRLWLGTREVLGGLGVLLKRVWALRWTVISLSVHFSGNAHVKDLGRRRAGVTVRSGYANVFFFPDVSPCFPVPISFPWTLFHNSVLNPWLLVVVVVRAAMGVSVLARVVRVMRVMVVSFAHDDASRLVLILVQIFWDLVSSHGGEGARLRAGRPDTLGVPLTLFDSDVCHYVDVCWCPRCARLLGYGRKRRYMSR